MGRLKGIASFLLAAVLVFLVLRLVHLVVPIFYPRVLAGPFSLDGFDEVEEYTGFPLHLPFYRPQELGRRPIHITVTRRPYPKVVIFWQGERFLYLAEQQGGRPASAPAEARPLPRHPQGLTWQEGATRYVLLPLGDLWIEMRTDLDLQNVERLVETLRPYEELL